MGGETGDACEGCLVSSSKMCSILDFATDVYHSNWASSARNEFNDYTHCERLSPIILDDFELLLLCRKAQESHCLTLRPRAHIDGPAASTLSAHRRPSTFRRRDQLFQAWRSKRPHHRLGKFDEMAFRDDLLLGMDDDQIGEFGTGTLNKKDGVKRGTHSRERKTDGIGLPERECLDVAGDW